MQVQVGDHILIESETVGTPTRRGEVLEILQGEVGVRFHVRWEDGHESTYTPSAGAVRVEPAAKKQPARKPTAKKPTARKPAPKKQPTKR
jgi:hypothetical protein